MMLPFFFFLIALFYSMVGFGGGSSYLAVMVIAGFHYQNIAGVALTCNLIVTLGGCYHFYKAGYLKLRNVLPFAVTSVPFAYLGGRLMIGKQAFCLLLGACLFIAGLRMFWTFRSTGELRKIGTKTAWFVGLPTGAVLGLLSGLVGIGGGIFLSPLLLVMRWVSVKEAAAAASLFIVLNSSAGLLGHLEKGRVDLSLLGPLAAAVFIGGQAGSMLGAYKLPNVRLQQVMGVLVFYASCKLLMGGF